MDPARGRLTALSAAVIAAAAVLAVLLWAFSASALTGPAAGTRVGASHPQMILAIGASRPVSAGEGRCEASLQAGFASGLCVAAEDAGDAGSGVLRHYTTQEAADAISKSGVIRPGAASGKIWLTPDEYSTGAEAQARLALNKTPDGYFEVPAERVQDPSAPSTVEPYYGQPGGGTEITTEYPISVEELPFILFEAEG